jgi:hypothetical protein
VFRLKSVDRVQQNNRRRIQRIIANKSIFCDRPFKIVLNYFIILFIGFTNYYIVQSDIVFFVGNIFFNSYYQPESDYFRPVSHLDRNSGCRIVPHLPCREIRDDNIMFTTIDVLSSRSPSERHAWMILPASDT